MEKKNDDDKPETTFYRTVTEMRGVPSEKIDHFCEDLRLWLHMHAQIAELQAAIGGIAKINITSPVDTFGWIDDGRHDVTIRVKTLEEPQAVAAVARSGEKVTE